MLVLQKNLNAAVALASGEVFTSFSLSENVSTSFCFSWLPSPCSGCRVLLWGSFCASTFPTAGFVSACPGFSGEQCGWHKISRLEEGQ